MPDEQEVLSEYEAIAMLDKARQLLDRAKDNSNEVIRRSAEDRKLLDEGKAMAAEAEALHNRVNAAKIVP